MSLAITDTQRTAILELMHNLAAKVDRAEAQLAQIRPIAAHVAELLRHDKLHPNIHAGLRTPIMSAMPSPHAAAAAVSWNFDETARSWVQIQAPGEQPLLSATAAGQQQQQQQQQQQEKQEKQEKPRRAASKYTLDPDQIFLDAEVREKSAKARWMALPRHRRRADAAAAQSHADVRPPAGADAGASPPLRPPVSLADVRLDLDSPRRLTDLPRIGASTVHCLPDPASVAPPPHSGCISSSPPPPSPPQPQFKHTKPESKKSRKSSGESNSSLSVNAGSDSSDPSIKPNKAPASPGLLKVEIPALEIYGTPATLKSPAFEPVRKKSKIFTTLAGITTAKYTEKGSIASAFQLDPAEIKRRNSSVQNLLFGKGLSPFSVLAVTLEFVMGLLYIGVVWAVPLDLGFNVDPHWSFSLILTLAFAIDTFAEMFTFRENHPSLLAIKNPTLKDWQLHYLRTNFVVDFITTLPFELISMPGSVNLIAIRLLRLYKLPNILLYSPKFIYLRKLAESALGIGETFSAILPLMFALCVFLHIETCALFMMGQWAGFSNSAIAQVQYKSLGDQYAWALFNAVGNTFPMTYKPISSPEQIITLIFIVAGAGLYASFVGIISSFAMGMDASGRLFRQKIDEVREYMRWRNIGETTKRKVMKYYDLKYRGKFFEEATLLSEMNESLRMEITTHNCKQLIEKVSFLRRQVGDGRDELFLGRIASALTACYFVPGDIIITQGEIGYEMFFILSGVVQIVVNGQQTVQFRDGACFGEVALIANIPRTASVQAATICSLYRLTRHDFLSILSEFEDVRERIEVIYNERMIKVKQEEEERKKFELLNVPRESGSAFVLNAAMESSNLIRLTPSRATDVPLEGTVVPTDSGFGQLIQRCPECKTTIYSHYAGFGKSVLFLRVGVMDEPGIFLPDVYTFALSKLPWVVLPASDREGDGEAKIFDQFYDRANVWRKESLERLEAISDLIDADRRAGWKW